MPVKREEVPFTPVVVVRPVTFPYTCGGLMMNPSVRSLPCAYYAPERRSIYVEPKYRDRVIKALHAIVANSIWKFRLKGDDKEAHEHAEVIPYYDPVTGPKKGDTQVFLDRTCVDVTYKYDCVRLVGGGGPPEWICRDPLTIGRCEQPARHECFETWDVVGQSNIYSDPECQHLVRNADLWGWSCLQL